MRYCVDIDGTICTLTPDPKTYEDAKPWHDRIETINKLYDEGNHITYFTARGMGRFSDDPNASVKASALLFDLTCLLYTSPSPRDPKTSRMPSSA